MEMQARVFALDPFTSINSIIVGKGVRWSQKRTYLLHLLSWEGTKKVNTYRLLRVDHGKDLAERKVCDTSKIPCEAGCFGAVHADICTVHRGSYERILVASRRVVKYTE